jgi:hypothetical protein
MHGRQALPDRRLRHAGRGQPCPVGKGGNPPATLAEFTLSHQAVAGKFARVLPLRTGQRLLLGEAGVRPGDERFGRSPSASNPPAYNVTFFATK